MRLSLQQFIGSLAAVSDPLDPCFLWSWLCLIRDAIKAAGQIELFMAWQRCGGHQTYLL